MTAVDHVLADLAAGRHGIVTRDQLRAAGLTERMVDRRIANRRLERLYPGVYGIAGLPRTWRAELAACALWAEGAAAGTSAAHIHCMPGYDEPVDPEIVTTGRHRVMPRCGIRARHTSWLPAEQVVETDGILCTSIERTVMDLFGFSAQRSAAIALDHTLHRGRATLASYDWCLFLTARRGRNGCGRLRDAVKARAGLVEFPNSPLETVVLEMLLRYRLPRPVLQYEIRDASGFVARPDFVYPQAKVVIEAHSKLWHEGRVFEERDARRHERLVAGGYQVIYVGWADATQRPHATAALIGRALGIDL